MVHEFALHRTEASWRCNLCSEKFLGQEQLRAHIDYIHKLEFLSPHIGEVITSSKILEMRHGDKEVCPFCQVEPAQTQRAFARHVGRHLQELSLAALPFLGSSSESDSDDGDDDNDEDEDVDDGASRGDYGSVEIARSHETTERPLLKSISSMTLNIADNAAMLDNEQRFEGPGENCPSNGPSPPASTARSSNGSSTTMDGTSRNREDGLFEASLAEHYSALKRYLAQSVNDRKGNSKARDKLLRLSHTQFQELSTDVLDELLRRQAAGSNEPDGVPLNGGVPLFLLPKDEFHPKRNQARQKLSTLPPPRFQDLATDVFNELERRFPRFARGDINRADSAMQAYPKASDLAQQGIMQSSLGDDRQELDAIVSYSKTRWKVL